MQLVVTSDETADRLARCIGQNWDGAFPRLFPSRESDEKETFSTYNNIVVSIASKGDTREIIVRSSTKLSEQMVGYVRKCADGSFYR